MNKSEIRSSSVVAYVVAEFPSPTELFILRELEGLRELGVSVWIFALRQPSDTNACPRASDAFLPRTTHAPSLWPLQLWGRAVGTMLRVPWRCIREIGSLAWHSLAGGRLRHFVWHLRHAPTALWLAAELRRRDIAHVHVHFAHVTSSVAMAAATIVGLPWTLSVHAFDLYVEPILLNDKLARAKKVVTCTQANRDFMLSSFSSADPERIRTLYHGMRVMDPTPTINYLPPAASNVLFIGRLIEKKGADILLRAFRKLRVEDASLRCRFIGDGVMRSSLEQMAGDLGVSGAVEFLGALPHEDAMGFLRRATLLVVPSRVDARGDRDGLPNVILEAAAVGVPVVASSVGAIPEFVEHGNTGLIVPSNDSVALAEAIGEVLMSPELAQRLVAGACKKAYSKFDAMTAVRALADLFCEKQ